MATYCRKSGSSFLAPSKKEASILWLRLQQAVGIGLRYVGSTAEQWPQILQSGALELERFSLWQGSRMPRIMVLFCNIRSAGVCLLSMVKHGDPRKTRSAGRQGRGGVLCPFLGMRLYNDSTCQLGSFRLQLVRPACGNGCPREQHLISKQPLAKE